jgi:hypothetical protein
VSDALLVIAVLVALLLAAGLWWSGNHGTVPLPEGPVLGWRAWRLDRAGNLCSLVSGRRLGMNVQRAVCDPRHADDKRPHEAPGQRCECGMHALSGYELTLRAVAHTERWERRAVGLLIVLAFGLVHVGALPALVALVVFRQARRRGIVFGVVALSGHIAIDPVAGGVQLRAERLRLVALMDSPAAAVAAGRYRVPLLPRRWIVARAADLSGAMPIDAWCLGRGPVDSTRWLIGWLVERVPSAVGPLVERAMPRRAS